ncbi:MAG: hypothetical protein DPW09_14045 [Anaerolineae bacterium]|nr:hypothetical protein [Anaerolineales bacterium]MCQ3974558.1 hypothetical protein [Anaerolineae bacterium]
MSDAALSILHHQADTRAAQLLAVAMAERGVYTSLGDIAQSRAVAVCLGSHGWDSRQKRAVDLALARQAEAEATGQLCPIIPVLLPGADLAPAFIFRHAWIDLRHTLADPVGLNRLAETARTGTAPLRPIASLIDFCPYPGLHPFREEDTAFFFGREAAAARLLDAIRQRNLVALVGPPASGKTSLIQAGLLPLLKDEGERRKDENFSSPFILHPSSFILSYRPGPQPFHRLAALFTDLLTPDLAPVERLATVRRLGGQLARGETRLEQLIDPALDQMGADRLLLVVDQFEEVLALPRIPQRRSWVEALLAALAHPQLTILLSLRADFYSEALQLSPTLSRLLEGNVIHLQPPTPAELAQAMVKPARLVTLAFEPGLVERLNAELAESPHPLLLLQGALVELWRRHQGGLLRHAFYDDFGGARGVVAHRAEQLFQGLTPRQQALARRVLVRLGATRLAGGLGLTRLAASLEVDAPGLRREVLTPLAEAGFLSIQSDPITGRPTVAITQPALAPYWPRWQGWLNEAHEFGLWRGRLDEAMAGWDRAEPKKQNLLQGPVLAEAERWLSERREWLDSEGWIFIWQSLTRWRWERDRRGLAGLGLVLLLIVGLAWLLVQQQMTLATLRQERNGALQAQVEAEAERQKAVAAQAEAETQIRDGEQQRQAILARALAAQAQTLPTEALEQSTLLAVESLRRLPMAAAEGLLRHNLALLPRPIAQIRAETGVQILAFSPDGRRLLTASGRELPQVWQVENGQEFKKGNQGGEVTSAALSRSASGLLVEPASAGHLQPAPVTAFSSDGGWAAAGDWDGTVRIWDMATGREVAQLAVDEPITALAFSPGSPQNTVDGWLAAGGWRGRVWLWRLTSQGVKLAAAGETLLEPPLQVKPEAAVTAHRDVVLALAFSPDGRQLASASADNTTKIWSLASVLDSGTLMPPALGGGVYEVAQLAHGAGVWSVAFNPTGRWLATGSADRTARLWDISNGSGREIGRLLHPDDVKKVLFSPNGLWLATMSSDDTARIWLTAASHNNETINGRIVAEIHHAGPINALAFSPNSRWLATASADDTSQVWETATGRQVAQIRHADDLTAVAFSPAVPASAERPWLATSSRDGSTRVWEVASGSEIKQLPQPDWILGLHFSPNGQWLAARSRFVVRVWGTASDLPVAQMEHADGWISSASFSPDSYWLATGSQDKTARLWQTATGKEVAKLDHSGPVHLVLFSPTGRQLATVSNDNIVRLWQTATTLSTGTAVGPRVIELTHSRWVNAVAFSPGGRWLATASRDHWARIWEAHTGRERGRLSHMEGVLDVAFSPVCDSPPPGCGLWLATASADHTARLWEAATNREITRLPHDSRVEAVLFSPDGRWLASRSGREVRLWDVAEVLTTRIAGDEQAVRLRHEESVRAMAFSPDGRWLATSTGNPPGTGVVQLWEVATGQEITRVAYDNWVNALAFSLDGRWLVNGGGDRLARVWLLQPEDLVEQACAHLSRNLTHSEWQQYLGEEPYHPTCPNLPFEN